MDYINYNRNINKRLKMTVNECKLNLNSIINKLFELNEFPQFIVEFNQLYKAKSIAEFQQYKAKFNIMKFGKVNILQRRDVFIYSPQ